VDPEFQKALSIVLVVGTLVVGAGATALYFIFRRFGEPKAGGQSHMLLLGGLIAFVLLMCFVFFALSRA
jgi:hypothetical protein